MPSLNLFGFGEAPPPSGPESAELKHAMLEQAESRIFQFRVLLWKWILWRRFDREAFRQKLRERSTYRCFANSKEMWRSIGWVDRDPNDPARWLFGVAGFGIWLIGASIMRHELFHAIQDLATGLFNKPRSGLMGTVRGFMAEISAHLCGGPLFATLALGPALVLFLMVYYGISVLYEAVGL